MNEDNEIQASEEALNQLVKRGNKLQLTWLIGSIVVIICVLYGDTAQLILAGLISAYLFIATKRYFKHVSLVNSQSSK